MANVIRYFGIDGYLRALPYLGIGGNSTAVRIGCEHGIRACPEPRGGIFVITCGIDVGTLPFYGICWCAARQVDAKRGGFVPVTRNLHVRIVECKVQGFGFGNRVTAAECIAHGICYSEPVSPG